MLADSDMPGAGEARAECVIALAVSCLASPKPGSVVEIVDDYWLQMRAATASIRMSTGVVPA